MKSKYFLQLIIFWSFLLVSSPAFSEDLTEDEAVEFANTQGQGLINTFSESDLRKKYEKLDYLFLNYIDLDYISRFVVGKYWRQMSEEQQALYQELFKRYSMSVYKGFPLQFNNNIDFTVNGARKEGDQVTVVTNIDYIPQNGRPVNFLVEFRMHKIDGVIKMTDIKVAESSLILSYRNRFYQMIRDAAEDMEWFLEDFELSTQSAEKIYALPDG